MRFYFLFFVNYSKRLGKLVVSIGFVKLDEKGLVVFSFEILNGM